MTPKVTRVGFSSMIAALDGDGINFSKIVMGNGEAPSDYMILEDLVNPLYTVGIDQITREEDFLDIKAVFSNANVESGFDWTEVGIFCDDPESTVSNPLPDKLYAYAHYSMGEVNTASAYVPQASDEVFEITMNYRVYVGEIENVTATLAQSANYATRAELDTHVNNENNPHSVTKEQVGLGNVDNYSATDMMPVFEEAETLENIESGERQGVLFGKIAKAVSDLIAHIGNTSNPHSVTYAQAGAAKSDHKHSAADITSGTLSQARGGTGAASLVDCDLAKVKTVTLNSGSWTSAAPYNQTVTVTGITNKMAPVISCGVPATANAANYKALNKAYAMIDRAVTGTNTITFYCYNKKPTVNIPLLIKGV